VDTTEWAADEELAPEPRSGEVVDDLARLHDVPVELSVEIGRTVMTLGQALGLGPGAIVELRRSAGEPVDLLAGGKPIARGEVVVVDEEFALRITEMVVDGGNGREGLDLDPAAEVAGEEPDAGLTFGDDLPATPATDDPQAGPLPADDQGA
jgi:flagellar motor switch protein FliN/FliY